MRNITFITDNLDKLKWLRMFTDLPLKHKSLDLHEIQSLSIEEIVEHKAKDAYKIILSFSVSNKFSLSGQAS